MGNHTRIHKRYLLHITLAALAALRQPQRKPGQEIYQLLLNNNLGKKVLENHELLKTFQQPLDQSCYQGCI